MFISRDCSPSDSYLLDTDGFDFFATKFQYSALCRLFRLFWSVVLLALCHRYRGMSLAQPPPATALRLLEFKRGNDQRFRLLDLDAPLPRWWLSTSHCSSCRWSATPSHRAAVLRATVNRPSRAAWRSTCRGGAWCPRSSCNRLATAACRGGAGRAPVVRRRGTWHRHGALPADGGAGGVGHRAAAWRSLRATDRISCSAITSVLLRYLARCRIVQRPAARGVSLAGALGASPHAYC